MFDITNINPSENSLSIWVPAIIGLLVGWAPPVFQFFTEGKKIKKQLLAQKKIDDLTNFKATLHIYYYETIRYEGGLPSDSKKDPLKISDKILDYRLEYNRNVLLVSHYFSKEENEKFDNFGTEFFKEEANTHAALKKENEQYSITSSRKTLSEKSFIELINIINNKINKD